MSVVMVALVSGIMGKLAMRGSFKIYDHTYSHKNRVRSLSINFNYKSEEDLVVLAFERMDKTMPPPNQLQVESTI